MKRISKFNEFNIVNENKETSTIFDEMKKKCEKLGDSCKVTKSGDGCKIVLTVPGSTIADLNDALKKIKNIVKSKAANNMKFANGKLTVYCS